MVAIVGGLAGIAFLTTDIMLEVQDFLVLPGIPEIQEEGTFICKCRNPNFNPNIPQFNIEWGFQFCDFSDPALEYFPSLMLCTWENTSVEYGTFVTTYQEGCNAGFWIDHMRMSEQRLNPDPEGAFLNLAWPSGYDPDNSFNDMFQTNFALVVGDTNTTEEATGRHDVATEDEASRTTTSRYSQGGLISDPTLEDALNARGGGINQLARESVAAMLNAAHSTVDYHYSVPEIMQITQKAIVDEDYTTATILLKTYNEANPSSICPN